MEWSLAGNCKAAMGFGHTERNWGEVLIVGWINVTQATVLMYLRRKDRGAVSASGNFEACL